MVFAETNLFTTERTYGFHNNLELFLYRLNENDRITINFRCKHACLISRIFMSIAVAVAAGSIWTSAHVMTLPQTHARTNVRLPWCHQRNARHWCYARLLVANPLVRMQLALRQTAGGAERFGKRMKLSPVLNRSQLIVNVR